MLDNNIKSIHIEYKNEGSLALNKVAFKERLTIRKDRISYKRKYYSIGNNYRWKVNISNMDEYISRIIEAINVEMINKGEELEEYDRVFYISYTYYDEDK